MPTDRTTAATAPPATRSAVTNGRSLFVEHVDQRSAVARRFRDLVAAIVSDLGGAENVSEGQRQLARRAAALSVQCELIEADMARGEKIDTEDFVRLVNSLNRTLGSIGLKRRARDVTPPDPLAYIRGEG